MTTPTQVAGPVIAVGLLLASACALPTSLGELPSSTESTSTPAETETTPDPGATTTTTVAPPTESEGTTDGVVGPQPMHAWVMRYDDWLMATDGSGDSGGSESGPADSGNGTGTGTEIAPDALVVQISTALDSCVDPGAFIECGLQWQIWMVIPPELQAPGSYDLLGELSAFASVTGELEAGDFCSGGAGTLEGTAALTVVSEQEVRGTLSGTEGLALFGFDADVEFVALGCG